MRRGRGQPRLEDRDFTDLTDHGVETVGRSGLSSASKMGDTSSCVRTCWTSRTARQPTLTSVEMSRARSSTTAHRTQRGGSVLDRQSFLSVACVRQAEIQAVADDAVSLQDELQRAAASVAERNGGRGHRPPRRTFCASTSVRIARTAPNPSNVPSWAWRPPRQRSQMRMRSMPRG